MSPCTSCWCADVFVGGQHGRTRVMFANLGYAFCGIVCTLLEDSKTGMVDTSPIRQMHFVTSLVTEWISYGKFMCMQSLFLSLPLSLSHCYLGLINKMNTSAYIYMLWRTFYTIWEF